MGPMGCGKTAIGEIWLKSSNGLSPIPMISTWKKTSRKCGPEFPACSAPKQTYRDILGVNQTTVRTVYLKGSYVLLRRRIAHREHSYMNRRLLRSRLDTPEEPAGGLTVDIRESPERIVGTIVESLGITGRA
jgi:gluconate kinase